MVMLRAGHLLSDLLAQREAGQDGQREDHHGQTVVGQEVDERSVERLHEVLRRDGDTEVTLLIGNHGDALSSILRSRGGAWTARGGVFTMLSTRCDPHSSRVLFTPSAPRRAATLAGGSPRVNSPSDSPET